VLDAIKGHITLNAKFVIHVMNIDLVDIIPGRMTQ
jgi:hypothetical protein